MPFKQPSYPTLLTDGSWQKKKGAVAKIAGKTGVGAALKKAEAAYGKVTWRTLDVNVNMPQGAAATEKAAEAVFKAAVAEFNSKVEGGLRKELIAARDLATKTAASWKKKALIPKDSVKAAEAVATAADQFMVALNKNSLLQQVAKDYQDNLAGIKKNEQIKAENGKRLKLYCVQVAKGLKSITTMKEFNGKFWDESVRGVGTALPMLSVQLGIVNEHKAWRKFASQDFKAKSDDDVAGKIQEMAPVLKKIAQAASSI